MPQSLGPHQQSRTILRVLLDPGHTETVPWSADDLRAMLAHQLATPLVTELDQLAARAQCTREQVLSILASSRGASFGDLLCKDAPSVRALKLVKDYAKAALTVDDDLPRDVARVLYILAILRGQHIGQEAMTSLDTASLTREIRRCLTFGWLPEEIRVLLRQGLIMQ